MRVHDPGSPDRLTWRELALCAVLSAGLFVAIWLCSLVGVAITGG